MTDPALKVRFQIKDHSPPQGRVDVVISQSAGKGHVPPTKECPSLASGAPYWIGGAS